MRRLIVRFQRRRALRRSAHSAERHIAQLENLLLETDQTLQLIRGEFDILKRSIQTLKEQQSKYQEENDSLRSELTVLKDVTIPGLVSANNLVLQRIEADLAVQVKRQVVGS